MLVHHFRQTFDHCCRLLLFKCSIGTGPHAAVFRLLFHLLCIKINEACPNLLNRFSLHISQNESQWNQVRCNSNWSHFQVIHLWKPPASMLCFMWAYRAFYNFIVFITIYCHHRVTYKRILNLSKKRQINYLFRMCLETQQTHCSPASMGFSLVYLNKCLLSPQHTIVSRTSRYTL